MAKSKGGTTIHLDSIAKNIEGLLSDLAVSRSSERYTEDLFASLFRLPELGLNSTRDEVPKIKTKSGIWRPDGVVFSTNHNIFEVFELKKQSVKLCQGQAPNYPSSQAYFQAVRYIAGSHTFTSDREIKRVFCFNGSDLVLVRPFSDDQLKLFLSRSPWKECKNHNDQEIEKALKSNHALVEAYFKFEYIASLPELPKGSDKSLFKHQVRHFIDSLLKAIGFETSFARNTISKDNLKSIYTEFCRLVTQKPEEHFVKIAPVWTKNNLFWFGKNGYLHIFQKDGSKVTDIPKDDIKDKNLDAVKELLESHVLDSPETFYDNYDTLLKPALRKKLGSYFTKKGLAGFAQYFLSEHIGKLSDFYIVDPAAGSGTLLAGLKAKSVFGTDIHEFKYSLMRERGVKHFSAPIDFLRTIPASYVQQLNEATDGDAIDNPLLILSNPPYLGHSSPDDLEKSLKAEIKQFKIQSSDLCSQFMVQMNRLFDGDINGVGKDLTGYIGVFSPTTWIVEDRGDQGEFRRYMLSQFSYHAGFKVNGAKFFDDMGQTVLFSILKKRKEVTWKEQDLVVPSAKILDLTASHESIKEIGTIWSSMPEIVRSGFAKIEEVADPITAKRFRKLESEISQKKEDESLTDFISQQPKFSKILSAVHCQTGDNDRSLSSMIINSKTSMSEVCEEFRSRLKLKLNHKEICEKLMLVYDDRSSGETGYRFVYLDKSKFPWQSMPTIDGPVLNYFEELKKSHRVARFYNAPPITTDIACAPIAKSPLKLDSKIKLIKHTGFKGLKIEKPEARYLCEFEDSVGDVRLLPFLRSFLSHLKPFKEFVNSKALDSYLVWAPVISDSTIGPLRNLLALSFAHALCTYRFKPVRVSYEGHTWAAEDYFNPDGWIKSSGLLDIVVSNFKPDLESEVLKAVKEAVDARRNSKEFDCSKLEKLGETLFDECGMAPAKKQKLKRRA